MRRECLLKRDLASIKKLKYATLSLLELKLYNRLVPTRDYRLRILLYNLHGNYSALMECVYIYSKKLA